MPFLIEQRDVCGGKAVTSESATLLDMLQFQEWYNGEDADSMLGVKFVALPTVEPITDVPVGSIGFVNKHLVNNGYPPLYHETIPECLRIPEFLGRRVLTGRLADAAVFSGDKLFVKHGFHPKVFPALLTPKDGSGLTETARGCDGKLFISEVLPEIDSEWRVFVKNGRILEARPYSFDIWPATPGTDFVERVVKSYYGAPPAYVCDVAVLKDGRTVLIEVHDFIAIGLYGFENGALPQMYSSVWAYYIRHHRPGMETETH